MVSARASDALYIEASGFTNIRRRAEVNSFRGLDLEARCGSDFLRRGNTSMRSVHVIVPLIFWVILAE